MSPSAEDETRRYGVEVRRLVFEQYVITYCIEEDRRTIRLLAMVHGNRTR
ncbi:MAG: hypothetical protein ACFCVE_05485 [Phycisphaerae bacterium]